jgi:50S ribosomal protein L16 3-hydroxylase
MLRDWLSPLTMEAFVQRHLSQRLPFARPGAAAAAVPLLDWDVLGAVLASCPEPDVLVASRGRLVDAPIPRSLAAARRLMNEGLGIVVRQSERNSPELAALSRSFSHDLPGEVHVQLYATPAGSQTFGWHFDIEDVFIAQTSGIKDYYFRDNTVTRPRAPGLPPDFGAVRQETSSLHSATLIPGDWLYIPTRWWHLVRSVEDALSISIGVIPTARSRRAEHACDSVTDRGLVRSQ